jgi:hypothetical protein
MNNHYNNFLYIFLYILYYKNLMSRSMITSNPNLTFRSSKTPNFPPGALVPGQRPDIALNSAQFAAARSARSSGTSQGLSGRALEIYVAQAAMNAK